MSIGVYDGHHRMPEQEEAKVRTLFNLRANDPIPEKFAKLYWGQRHLQCRLGITVMRDEMLCWLALCAGVDAAGGPPPSIYDLWRDRKIKKNAQVTYVYRDEQQVGRLVSVEAPRRKAVVAGSDNVTVEVDGDTVEPYIEQPQTAGA